MAIQEGDVSAWNNLGVVYERTGRLERAKSAYTLAARYGIPVAQQNLLRLGEPVPSVDLKVMQAPVGPSALELLLVGATSYHAGKNSMVQPVAPRSALYPVSPASTKCTSKFNEFTKEVETVCK